VVCDITHREFDSRKGARLLGWEKTTVKYKIDDKTYYTDIYSYNDASVNDEIKIAVNNNNPSKVLRCVPYDISDSDITELLMGWIPAFLLGMYWCVLYILRNKKKQKLHEQLSRNQEASQMDFNELSDKQLDILSLMNINRNDYNSSDYKSEFEKTKKELKSILDINVNDELVWYIVWGRRNDTCKRKIEEYMNEVKNMTEQLMQKGLMYGYYYIDKCNEYFLVGKESSTRLYLFSYSLGITNTQYSSIYDYIIEKEGVDNKRRT
jgi:hypothetical protein